MKRLPVPSRSSLPESWCGCICQCWRPPFKTQIRGGQISSWVSLKTSVYHPWKRTLKPPIPSHIMTLKDVFHFLAKRTSCKHPTYSQSSQTKTSLKISSRSASLRSESDVSFWQQGPWKRNGKAPRNGEKKIGVQKSLPPNRDDQNRRCSVEYVGGIGGLYTVSWLIFMDCSKLL